jgi:hypothetical protein
MFETPNNSTKRIDSSASCTGGSPVVRQPMDVESFSSYICKGRIAVSMKKSPF